MTDGLKVVHKSCGWAPTHSYLLSNHKYSMCLCLCYRLSTGSKQLTAASSFIRRMLTCVRVFWWYCPKYFFCKPKTVFLQLKIGGLGVQIDATPCHLYHIPTFSLVPCDHPDYRLLYTFFSRFVKINNLEENAILSKFESIKSLSNHLKLL